MLLGVVNTGVIVTWSYFSFWHCSLLCLLVGLSALLDLEFGQFLKLRLILKLLLSLLIFVNNIIILSDKLLFISSHHLVVGDNNLGCVVIVVSKQRVLSRVRIVGVHHVLQESLLLLQGVLQVHGFGVLSGVGVARSELVHGAFELRVGHPGVMVGVGGGALEVVCT